MKRYIKTFVFATLSSSMLMGCINELEKDSEGSLNLHVGIRTDVSVKTKTSTSPEENCVVKIYSKDGLIRRYNSLTEIPTSMMLSAGGYTVNATAGDSVPASFNQKFFRGEEPFEIKAGQPTAVELVCRIANSLVTVAFDQSMNEVFSSYNVEVGNANGKLVFTSEHTDSIGYFMNPVDAKVLNYKLIATTVNGGTFERSGELLVEPTTRYDLAFSYKNDDSSTGGGSLNLTIDTTPLEQNESEIPVYLRPQIKGDQFDIARPLQLELGSSIPVSFSIATSSKLTAAILACESFPNWGFASKEIDLRTLDNIQLDELQTKGITVLNQHNAGNGTGYMQVTFEPTLISQITAVEGVFPVTITAKDENEKQQIATLQMLVSNATVATLNPVESSIYTNRAILRGETIRETEEVLGFRYREQGTSDWTSVIAQVEGTAFYASISGLKAGTMYEYQAMAGEGASTITATFTTESMLQMPNNSFEDWSGSSPLLIFGNGQEMFWDSGNHGSATMSKNVTTPDESISHAGARSIKLQSQFVGLGIIGKFAAGNLFVGKYLKTEGTDGILGWGRPFASRPTALRGYIKYRPGTVDYSSTDKISKGDLDKGIVYIALGDWAGEEYEGVKWSQIVKTKQQQFFDPSPANTGTIAYGEYELTAATEGEQLIEFTIPLDYRDTRKPVSLILVASASKYGDYFSGSSSSAMWLDSLEFIYE